MQEVKCRQKIFIYWRSAAVLASSFAQDLLKRAKWQHGTFLLLKEASINLRHGG